MGQALRIGAAVFAVLGVIVIALGNGNGTFGSASTITVGSDKYVSFVAVGDLNNDGKQDLAVVYNNEDASGELARIR